MPTTANSRPDRSSTTRPGGKIAVLALAAAVLLVGAAVYAWVGYEPNAPSAPSAEATARIAADEPARPAAARGQRSPGLARAATAAARDDRTGPDRSAPPTRQHQQGLRGRVQDAFGQALPSATVHLVESAGNDPLLLHIVHRQRHLLAPVATARPAADGSFAVGLAVAQDKVYDLFVLSPQHATLRLTGLRLVRDSWHDLGDLTMHAGTTLRGRVTIADSPSLPVPNAVVSVVSGGAFVDAAMRAMPGQQGALVAHADHDGYYELPHAPTSGIVLVSAVASGFARVTQNEVEMKAPGPIELDFALPPGKSLAGEVRTTTGKPIANARIEAWPAQANLPPLTARSDESGRFIVRGMRPGPHRVRANATGFAQAEQAEVLPGKPLLLTLAPLRRIQLTVRTPRGAILRTYRLGLRRFFASDPGAPLDQSALATGRIGSLPQVADQHVRLDPATDHAEIRGVPVGTFVCVVTADGFAKSLSTPLRIDADAYPAGSVIRAELVVSQGHLLRGQVLSASGTPLAGATVETQSNGTLPDSPVLRVLQAGLPRKISPRTVQTDQRGLFELPRLALGRYQLQVTHPDACRQLVRNIDCTRQGETTLPPVRLAHGSRIEGTATVAGRAKGQIKLVLTTPAKTPADRSLRLETVTDGEGRYRFARRIRPGTYQLRATTVGSQAPDSEIFHQLLQLKRSSTTLLVPTGQDVVQHDVILPAAN